MDRDRVKAATCASADIPIYWIVNPKQCQLEVFYFPQGNDCTNRILLEPHDDVIVSSGFRARTTINVGDLIPESTTGEPDCLLDKDFSVAEFVKDCGFSRENEHTPNYLRLPLSMSL